ncbi:enhancer of mRNA decapping [Cryomyces antarcticus]|uniref:Enhancer of mRNA-decapping protein 3 n=1 Tax=Cryomyces antarcticus TaxID=329879 RepID=A0ABR0LQC1_9PEZI|nr:enhancer of mRNA decapping [Cryomyces antarcticus]
MKYTPTVPVHPDHAVVHPTQAAPIPQPMQQPPTPAKQQQKGLVDPAILSYGNKPPVPPTATSETLGARQLAAVSTQSPSTPSKSAIAAAIAHLPTNSSPFIGTPNKPSSLAGAGRGKRGNSTLVEQLGGMKTNGGVGTQDDVEDLSKVHGLERQTSAATVRPVIDTPVKHTPGTGKKPRNKKKSQTPLANLHSTEAAGYSSPDVSRRVNVQNGGVQSKNGWRSTPILQETTKIPGVIGGNVGQQAVSSSNRKNRRQRIMESEVQSGWATEDALDIQEMGEFDFAGNLSKFDKRTVFDQIRNEDTTADEDRLVSFNRLPPARPGTYGGKNLHPTENVLDSPKTYKKYHSSELSSSSASDIDLNSGQASRTSTRAMSRASAKRVPLRTGSGMQDHENINLMTGSFPSALLNRSNRSLSRPVHSSSQHTASPNPNRLASPPLASRRQSDQPLAPSFRLIPSDLSCPTVTPTTMLEIETVGERDMGISEAMLSENAARGIAEVALSAINPGGRRLSKSNTNASPVVVVLAGNHRSGARAVAAARHLAARGVRVMVAVLGYDKISANGLVPQGQCDPHLWRQVRVLKKVGGLVKGWATVERQLKKLDAPPELIVDALLSRTSYEELMDDSERKVALEIVGWANKSKAGVLAIDVPSGVDGTTGATPILEGEPLEIRARFVVALGIPLTGLLLAAAEAALDATATPWLITVVDIGIAGAWNRVAAAMAGEGGVTAAGGTGGTGGIGVGGLAQVGFGSAWSVGVRCVTTGE